MASRHEIVTIDFRANAAKANPAMKSLQQAAHDLREEIEKTRSAATEAAKNGAPEAELQKFENELISQMKTLKQYDSAINTLSKGVGTLARAIDAFNAGTLDKMNAAFQKQSFNAAENAKKLLVPGSEGYEKNMAELDALQQKNLENLAKYKLRTEQLLQSIGEGGKISATDLKTEADGLEELMRLLPHLGNEWQEYYQILLRVRDAIKQQADEEKRLKGTIVDARDARERSAQLTKQGAENARQQHEAAKKEADSQTAIIEKLKEEREEKRKNMADSAAVLQQKDKEIEKQKKIVAAAESAIDNEKKDAKAREKRIDTLKQENETLETTATKNREAVEKMKGDMKGLEDQLKGVNEELKKMETEASAKPAAPATVTPPATPATAAKKEETQAVDEKAEADKKETQAVKEKTEAKKKETETTEEVTAVKEEGIKTDEELWKELENLRTERESLLKQQELERSAAEKEAQAVEREANAFANLSKEEANALLQKKQMQSTISKGTDSKFAYSNGEEAQYFLLDTIKNINPNAIQGNAISLNGDAIAKVKSQFKERYGIADDADVLPAIQGLLSGENGSLIKMGMMSNGFSRIDFDASKFSKLSKEIKDLTDVVNGNTKSTEENTSAGEAFITTSTKLADVESTIAAKEAEQSETSKLLTKLRNGEIKDTDTLTQKTQKLTDAQKKRVETLWEEIDAIKEMSKEEAEAAYNASQTPAKVRYKGGKISSTDMEEVQQYLIGRMKHYGAKGADGTLTLKGEKVTDLIKDFKTRYNAVDKNAPETDLTFAKQLLGDVLKSGEGMFAFGESKLKGKAPSITVEYLKDIYDARIEKTRQLIAVKTGAKKIEDEETESIEENTEAAKKNTEAVKEESKAIQEQREKVKSLETAYNTSKDEHEKMKQHLGNLRRKRSNLPSGMDGDLERKNLDEEIGDYEKNVSKPKGSEVRSLKTKWTNAQKKLEQMIAAEDTAATDHNTEAVERNTQARGRKRKATQDATAAQQQQNKVDAENIAQEQQLSAEEQKKQELLRKRETLQGQLNDKQTEANRLEEEAAGADTKKENNLKTITDLQNENINAHTKNEQAYGREKEELEKLENQQGQNIKKYNEAKEAVQDYDKQIDEHASKRVEANKRAAQTERLTIDAMNDAIKAMEEENRAIDPQSAKWMENTRVIRQYKDEIDRLKNQPALQMMTERMGNIKNLSANALAETKKFWEQMAAGAEHGSHKLAVYEGNLKVIAEEERQRRMEIQKPMRENLNNLGRLSANDLTETKRYWEAVRDGAEAGSAAYKKAELAVKALGNEEKRRKDNDMAQYVNDQMRDLNNLSVTGLAEVKRYWEAMANGAKRGSDEAKDAANALRQINTLENDRLKESADRLNGNLGRMSQGDLRQAIDDAKKYQLTLGSTSKEAKELAERIVTAEEHIKRYGVEAEREARRQEDADKRAARAARDKAEADMQAQQEQRTMMMQRSMESQRKTLSAEALAETKKYWEAVARGAEEGSVAQRNALTIMERITDEEKRRNTERNKQLAKRLDGNYADYSEAEMREAISAGQQLIQTYKVGSQEANVLATKIVDAENHVKQYGVEAERQAQQQAKSIQDMKDQLDQGTSLSQQALKAQEQYWQQLIDNPKTAGTSLAEYRAELKRTQELQKEVAENDIRNEGIDTLRRAENGDYATASISSLDDAIKKLKAYQALVKDPEGLGKETFDATKVQIDALTAKLNSLKGVAEKVTGTFASADEVMTRWAEHMNAGKTASESMAQTLDDKLNAATSRFDDKIKEAVKDVENYDKEIAEQAKYVSDIEQELARLEQKHANSSWLRKKSRRYRDEGEKINELRNMLDAPLVANGNGDFNGSGEKAWLDYLKKRKQERVEYLDFLRQTKAAELGITEETISAESKKQEAHRLTQAEMQEGIKLLEEEYAKTDHTTEKGIKKREQLRDAIDQMNQELKESTGEWMKLADAEKLAEQAGKDTFLNKEGKGFIASPEEIQKATQALERRRDALIKNMKTSGEATKEQERELADLTKKIKDLKFEQDNLNMSQEKMQMLMRTPTNAVSLDELRAAIKRADGELKRMEGSLGQNNDQYKAFAEQVKNAKNQLKEMEGQAKASATAWEKAWSRLKTYVVMYMGFNAVWQKMVGTADDLMQLSDKMGEVRKTTGFTADEVGRLSDNLKRLDVRTPLTQLMEISAKAGQLGLKTEQDVMGFTEAANKLMIALPEMGAEAATEMMKVALATGEVKKIQDQLNQGIVEGSSATEVALSKIGSTIDQLRANSAAAAPQITDFVKRVGAVGAQSGITIDQVAALGATVDAVGLRVEMSATALSRMIPAIRNNAFEVAKAIGMTPNALREMFDEAGGGMEAMLAIFQHIKDSGMDEDSIEKMLGIGNMQDVMKQLNQQGARAGIVFAGLSQNVDELRRNLGVAKEAYEDNIAILQEYNKMNDTTAAKWERFKNELEEFFVGDFSQRFLGGLISVMRGILEIFIGNNGWSAALRTIGVYLLAIKLNIAGIFSGVKNISFSLKGIAMAIGLIDKETKKLAWGNIFTAAAAAILWVVLELKNLKSALDKASESLGKTKEEVNRSIDRFEGYWAKLKSTNEALLQAKASHEKLSAEVDKLRKSTDGSAESTANLKKKEDELTTSEKNVTKASNDHKSAISQMNSIYGKYLGFILTEANYSNLAAAAHDKVTAAIEREMLMKQRQAAIGEVDSNYSDNIATGYGDLNERLVQHGKLSRSEAAKAMGDMQRFMRENLKYDAGTNATVVSKAIMDQLKKSGLDVSKADANEIAGLWFDQYLKENYNLSDKVRRGLTGVERRSDMKEGWANVYTPFATNLRGGYAETYAQREQARGAVSTVYNVDIADSEKREASASSQLLANLEKSAKNAKKVILDKNVDEKKRNEAYGELANALEGLDNRINELDPQKDAATIERLNSMAKSLKGEGIDIKKLKQAREKIHQTLFERATFNEEDIRNLDTTNPWGGSHEASSTDWKNMTAEQLVARRKQMNEFVKSIQTDSDVKTVLGEDAALKKAIEKGMSSDMRTVIEWYNTERLKIQDELHARHLTNTGDWMDPKKQKNAHKQFQNEVKAYLEELDAYYTERNQEIQTARNNEEITEAEAWRRTINNETEWYNRRAELQKLYAEKGAEVTKEEQDAIFAIIAERTGDSTTFIQQMIGKTIQFAKQIEKTGEKGAAVVHKWRADLGLGYEKDFLKSANSIGKQMKFIEDTLAKERPYDGITKNLQENLDKMGILAAQYKRINDELVKQGKEPKYSNQEITAQTYKEMAFYLRQAEDAWSISIDELLKRMAEEGMETTAEEISKSELLKQAVMGQLRKTFEEVQNAVKKEASQIKKDVDILWNDDTRGPGGMSMKAAYDKAIARLGMQQDSVSRANSLIGAGAASDNVAARLAMKQIEMQMRMQKAQFDMYRVQANQKIVDLKKEAAEHKRIADLAEKEGRAEEAAKERLKATIALRDAENVRKSLGLTLAEETKKEEESIANLLKLQEESQNRLYTSLREWATLLSSSVQSVFEASHAGEKDYYNERAKMELTGKGGPGAGTYIIIDNEGTEDAKAHYEYLDERQALERQLEIERQNAEADAWKKVMDDFNQKLNDYLTDQLNAMMQNQAINANTDALNLDVEATKLNTAATDKLTDAIGKGLNVNVKTPPTSAPVITPTAAGAGKGGNAGTGTPAFAPQTLTLEVDSVKAVKDLTSIPGISIDDNTLTLKFDSTEAVKQFQRLNKLKADGIVGPKTMAKLNERGITKASEARYEVGGKTIGFDDEQAIRDFQKQYGIRQTGAVGEKTMAKLDELGATKVQDMTFNVDLQDKKALEYVEQLNTFKLADKSFNVKVNDQSTMDAINSVQDITIKDKQFTITAKMKKDGELPDDSDFAEGFPKQTPSDTTQGGGDVPERKEKYDVSDADSWSYAERKREGLPADSGQQPDALPVQMTPEMSSEATDGMKELTDAMKELTQTLGFMSDNAKEGEKFSSPEYDESDPSTWGYAERKRAGYRVDDAEPDEMPLGPEQAALRSEEELGIDQANTDATVQNTEAVVANTEAMAAQGGGGDGSVGSELSAAAQQAINESDIVTEKRIDNNKKETKSTQENNKKQQQSSSSMFAKMTQAANLYGVAYQAMSNDNLDTTQKFQMIALQAVGNAAIAGLQVALSQGTAQTAAAMPGAAAQSSAQAGPIAGPILFAILSALVGGLMGLAASKVAKSKSQISQVTGASVNAGRLSTGMLTYAEGNVNEFTDPNSLTPGRMYNVDAADGKTYRAKYTGRNPKTHITNGPEFHLSGEKGREAIIDAHTTQLIRMNDTGIWKSIQTLYNGGGLRSLSRMRHGVRAFADGNLDDFEEVGSVTGDGLGGILSPDMMTGFQQSLDRNSDVMEQLARNGIKAYFDVYGKGGLVDSYDTGKKNVQRHGERY